MRRLFDRGNLVTLFMTVAVWPLSFGQETDSEHRHRLEPLRYQHPGLVVDLGVGLWAWPIPWDVDDDGDFDLIVSCPDKPSNGIWFFENRDGPTTSTKFPVFQPPIKLSSAVHYVMPSYIDGGLRVLSPGHEYPDFLRSGLRERVNLPVDANFYQTRWGQKKGPGVRHNQWRYVDYDQDSAVDLVVGIEDWSDYGWDDARSADGTWLNGPLHGFVFVFRNLGTTQQPRYARPEQVQAGGDSIDVYGCPTPNFVDFDGDRDLDLLCGEFLDGLTYFENVGSATEPRYGPERPVGDPLGRPIRMDVQMIVPIAFDWDLDGDYDLVVGDEDGRVALVENVGTFAADGSPQFLPPRWFQQHAETLKCGALATPYAVDWDGDGDQDLLSGNTAGYIEYFENLSGPGIERPRWQRPQRLEAGGKTFRIMAGEHGSVQGPAEAKWGYTTLAVEDWDHDSLPDIVLNSIFGEVLWLRNIGTRTVPLLAQPQPVTVSWKGDPPKPRWTWWTPGRQGLVTQWRTTPIVVDWDRDGLRDLLMLDHEGFLAFFRRIREGSSLVLAPPERVFVGTNFHTTDTQHRGVDGLGGLMRLNGGEAGASGRRKLCVVDWDQDGPFDFLVNSTSANFLRGVGERNGVWEFEDRGPLSTMSIQGHTTSPCVVDFNADGVPDFLGGAEDGRFYYLRNPLR